MKVRIYDFTDKNDLVILAEGTKFVFSCFKTTLIKQSYNAVLFLDK